MNVYQIITIARNLRICVYLSSVDSNRQDFETGEDELDLRNTCCTPFDVLSQRDDEDDGAAGAVDDEDEEQEEEEVEEDEEKKSNKDVDGEESAEKMGTKSRSNETSESVDKRSVKSVKNFMLFELQISYLNEILQNKDQDKKFKVKRDFKKWKLDHSYSYRVIEDSEQNVLRLSGNYFKVTLVYQRTRKERLILATGELDISAMVSERPMELEGFLPLQVNEALTDDTTINIRALFLKYKVWATSPVAPPSLLFRSHTMSVQLKHFFLDSQNLPNSAKERTHTLEFKFPMKSEVSEPISFSCSHTRQMQAQDLDFMGDEKVFYDSIDREICLNFVRSGNESLAKYQKVEFDDAYKNLLTRHTFEFVKKHFGTDKKRYEFELKVSPKINLKGSLNLSPFLHPGVKRGIFLLSLVQPEGRRSTVDEDQVSQLSQRTSKTSMRSSKRISTTSSTVNLVERKTRGFAFIEIEFSNPWRAEESIEGLVNIMENPLPISPMEITNPEEDKELFNILQNLNENVRDAHQQSISKRNFMLFVENTNMRTDLTRIMTKKIANHFNVLQRTKTNHDFKKLICDVFDYYSNKAHEIIEDLQNVEQREFELKDYEDRIFLAKLALHLGDINIANEIYKQLIGEFGKQEEVFLDYIIHLDAVVDHQNATKTMLRLLQINPKSLGGLILCSYQAYHEKKTKDSINILKMLALIVPTSLEVWLLLYCLLLGNNNDFEEEIYIFAQIVKLSEDSYRCYLHSRKEITFREFPTDDPKKFSNILKAVYFLVKLGCWDFAELILKRIDRFKVFFKIDEFEITNLRLINQIGQRKFSESLTELKDIDLKLKKEGNAALRRCICSLKGHCYYEMKEYENAIREYEISYHILGGPVQPDYYLAALRCGINFMQTKEYEEAKDYLVSCCRDLPTYYSWKLLGINYFERQLLDKSEKCFNQMQHLSMGLMFDDVQDYLDVLRERHSNKSNLYPQQKSFDKRLTIYFNKPIEGKHSKILKPTSSNFVNELYFKKVETFDYDGVDDV